MTRLKKNKKEISNGNYFRDRNDQSSKTVIGNRIILLYTTVVGVLCTGAHVL